MWIYIDIDRMTLLTCIYVLLCLPLLRCIRRRVSSNQYRLSSRRCWHNGGPHLWWQSSQLLPCDYHQCSYSWYEEYVGISLELPMTVAVYEHAMRERRKQKILEYELKHTIVRIDFDLYFATDSMFHAHTKKTFRINHNANRLVRHDECFRTNTEMSTHDRKKLKFCKNHWNCRVDFMLNRWQLFYSTEIFENFNDICTDDTEFLRFSYENYHFCLYLSQLANYKRNAGCKQCDTLVCWSTICRSLSFISSVRDALWCAFVSVCFFFAHLTALSTASAMCDVWMSIERFGLAIPYDSTHK